MLSALLESPLTAKQVFEWKEKLEKNELLVREIVDIDSAYVDFDAEEESSISVKNKLKTTKEHKSEKPIKETKEDKDNKNKEDKDNKNNEEYSQEDEFNPSLAAMEEEVKPQVISTINNLSKSYNKLIKYQNEKLNCVLNSKEFSRSKLTSLKKTQSEIVGKIKNLQLNPSVLEDLVMKHYQENKKIVSLDGFSMRLALENKISREEFLKYYLGNEINPKFQSFLNENSTWKNFFKKKKKDFTEIRDRLI